MSQDIRLMLLLPTMLRQPIFPPRAWLLLWPTPKHFVQPAFGERVYTLLGANTDQMVTKSF